MNEHLLRMKRDVRFCVFDFETEDLNLFTSKPWQFACVVGMNGRVIQKKDIYVRWADLNISREAEQITRFNHLYWEAHARDPKEVFEEINEEFDKADWIVGHNILGYDIHVYRNSCRKLGIKPLPIHKKMLDTYACGKGIKLEAFYKPSDDFRNYQIRLLNERVMKRGFATLNAFSKLYDIPTDESKLHDALYDVEINYEVFKKMIWNIEI